MPPYQRSLVRWAEKKQSGTTTLRLWGCSDTRLAQELVGVGADLGGFEHPLNGLSDEGGTLARTDERVDLLQRFRWKLDLDLFHVLRWASHGSMGSGRVFVCQSGLRKQTR